MDHVPVHTRHRLSTARKWQAGVAIAAAAGLVLLAIATNPTQAFAATTPVGLGTAGSFSVLAGSTVTNTGPSITGSDVGVSPGSAITGFPPGLVLGTIHAADAVAAQAQADLTIAYNDAAGRSPVTAVGPELGGLTLVDGVYGGGSLQITGPLTLDGQGDPNAVFIFQAASTLITASGSSVSLINGAQACNVFWQIGSSATLGTGSTFVGDMMALTSISVQTGVTVQGRALARNGAVTLDTSNFTPALCTPPTTATPPATATVTATPTVTATVTATPTATITPTVTTSPSATPTNTSTDSPSATPTGSASSTPSPSGIESSVAAGGDTTGPPGTGGGSDNGPGPTQPAGTPGLPATGAGPGLGLVLSLAIAMLGAAGLIFRSRLNRRSA